MPFSLMRRAVTLTFVMATCAPLFPQASTAQKTDHPERKIVSKVAPEYPELAKRMHVGGIVKVEVVVGANGSVKSTRVVGGNPVLIESATDAIRKWKFEAASISSTEVFQVTFEAQ
jgi:TonB family protein